MGWKSRVGDKKKVNLICSMGDSSSIGHDPLYLQGGEVLPLLELKA
jgi:hypothetical protein